MLRYKITKVYIREAENEDAAIRMAFEPDIDFTDALQFESLQAKATGRRRWTERLKERLNHKR